MKFAAFICCLLALPTLAWPDPYEQSQREMEAAAQAFFPKIEKGNYYPFALLVIAKHATEHQWPPLPSAHLRVVTQPNGIVGKGYLVSLNDGLVKVYPGTHDKEEIRNYRLPPEQLQAINNHLRSEAFQAVPSRTNKLGLDGSSIFVEYQLDDDYFWICHWQTDSEDLKRLLELIKYGQ